MSRQRASGFAWSILALAVAFQLGSIFFGLQTRAYEPPGYLPHLDRVLLFLPALLAAAVIGALVASRQPQHPVGWLFLAIGTFGCAGGFAEGAGRYVLTTQASAPPAGAFMLWLGLLLYSFDPILIPLALLLFPDGRLPSPRWRVVHWLVLLSLPLMLIAIAFKPGPIDVGSLPGQNPDSPFGVDSAAGVLDVIEAIGGVLMVLGVPLVLLSLVLRFRRSRGIERQQMKWFAYGASLYIVSFLLNLTILSAFEALEEVAFALWAISSSFLAVTVGISILRYRLYDIDLLINRTLVYALLTGALALIYYGSVVLLQPLLGSFLGGSSELAIVASTLAIAALFNPLRQRIQAFIDRHFYRRKYDAEKTLASFATTARDEVELERLTAELLRVVEETMRPTHISLWLRELDKITSRRETRSQEVQ